MHFKQHILPAKPPKMQGEFGSSHRGTTVRNKIKKLLTNWYHYYDKKYRNDHNNRPLLIIMTIINEIMDAYTLHRIL